MSAWIIEDAGPCKDKAKADSPVAPPAPRTPQSRPDG